MPLIEGDFAELLHAVATGRLGDIEPPTLPAKHAMTVIVAARGYPGTPASGGTIREIEAAEQVEGATVFHAGTALGERRARRQWRPRARRDRRRRHLSRTRGRAPTARSTRSTSPTGFHRRDIGWRELAREDAMNALWTYSGRSFGAGLAIGVIAGLFGFRVGAAATQRRSRSGSLASIAAGCALARAAGRGRPLSPRGRTRRAQTLDHYRNARRSARICIAIRSTRRDPVRTGRRFPARASWSGSCRAVPGVAAPLDDGAAAACR